MSAYRNMRSFKEQVPPSLFKAQMQKKREISIARREHSATLWRGMGVSRNSKERSRDKW